MQIRVVQMYCTDNCNQKQQVVPH